MCEFAQKKNSLTAAKCYNAEVLPLALSLWGHAKMLRMQEERGFRGHDCIGAAHLTDEHNGG